MANKKLKVEVELETAKAKRQAKELEQSGGASATGGESVAPALDKTSKAAESAAKSFQQADRATLRLATGFAGLAVGLATSYAASYVKDPNAKAALQYTGSVMSGASTGATIGMAGGPKGMLIGALIGTAYGAAKTFLDRKGVNDDAITDYQKGEETYSKAREWSKQIKSITGIGEIKDYDFIKNDGERLAAEMKDVADHLEKTKFHIDILNSAIPNIQAAIKKMQDDGETDTEEYKKLIEELQEHRSKLSTLENAEDFLTKQEHNLKVEKEMIKVNDRPGFSAPDALSRIGGAFAGQSVDPETRTQTATMKEQLEVLKRIEQKSGGKF